MATQYPPPGEPGAGRRWLLAAGLTVVVALLASAAFVISSPGTEDGGVVGVALDNRDALYSDPDAPVRARVDDLLDRMTLEEKVGQMTMVDRDAVAGDPGEIARYGIGALLSAGGSSPDPNTPEGWANMYDDFQRVALDSRLGVPLLYGTDAVHGHNNLRGATVFPHNIGLGAAGDPDLVEDVAAATAIEAAATGIDWNFAPCLCVARDERWGRTYESFGEDPDLVTEMATAITGYQGDELGRTGMLATAKHYLGDGGTTGGDDQGDTRLSEAELRAVHLPPFAEAVDRGVGAVMVSFSSWNGEKLHGSEYLISGVLKDELGFDGIVVSDWGGVAQVAPVYADAVRAAVNAGIDMVMVPDDYERFTATLTDEVEAGRISEARVDDAVTRILTTKVELGVFEEPLTDRSLLDSVGSSAHRALAREAVARSVTLLSNSGGVLPLDRGAKLFVAGKNADDIGNQSGGWTIEWQGASGDITPGTTILEGIEQVAGGSTQVTFDREGEGIDATFDAAVVVVGETPYAEFEGDRTDDLRLDAEDRATLERVRSAGVPVVVVLVSGRPLVVTEELPTWDALLAAWLPGTEGAGVADVLFGDERPTGKLPMSWPRDVTQLPLNAGDPDYDPLFPFGFGLTYQ